MRSILGTVSAGLAALLKTILVVVFTLLVVDVLWGVATRYLLGGQARWSEELARLLMVWLALLGAALVAREERHLGLDALVRQWPAAARRQARVFAHAVVLGFALVIMLWGGAQLAAARFESGQLMPALGISRGWFYLALPISGALIGFFQLESLLHPPRGSEAAAGADPGGAA